MALNDDWYTEIHAQNGSAFSLKVKEKLHSEQTPFQRIDIYETETFGTLMTIDGLTMVSDLDNFVYHEMVTHPALYAHANPRHVLVIGGGDCGSLKEVLKHPSVETCWQVEIDERVTRLAERYFPELCASNGDPRARLVFDDGLKWVKEARPESLDVIIIDSTDPIGPAEGLFTEAFYRDCVRALRPGGIIIQQSESPLYHKHLIAAIRQALRSSGFSQTRTLLFPQCIYPSGWWSATLGGKGVDPARFREQDAVRKPFATQYYTAEVHRAAFAMPSFMLDLPA